MTPAPRLAVLAVAGALGVAIALPVAVAAAAGTPAAPDAASARQADFTRAAADFGVPASVLLAVSYAETGWEAHRGQPSSTGAYGPMALTDVPAGTPSAKGDGATLSAVAPAAHTLLAAAALTGAQPAALKADDRANIRGGAALLASYARQLGHGALPGGVAGWYRAVARFAGTTQLAAGRQFADDVYATIRDGATASTTDGQRLALPGQPGVRPDTSGLAAPNAPNAAGSAGSAKDATLPECPRTLTCSYVPAAYAQTGASKLDYGNYDLANRPSGHLRVDYIVIHDTEESYASTIEGFQNPNHYASAQYVVDGTAGTVTQMVPTKDIAWHAGNWYVNMHSVGIEQVGFAVQGATWFTERLYRTTATLVHYLADRYGVQLDRQHILGHDNVPGIAPAYIPGMHWDPGPFWNWGHFMALLGQHTDRADGRASRVVTINPVFADNLQSVVDCEQNQPLPAQAASFVYLRTAPSATAPLFNDPGLHPGSAPGTAGTNCAADWGDKASAGQQFVVADRQGDWVAIWWDGAKVWFENPVHHRVATRTSAVVVRPRDGLASVPTFGVAYPDATEYPADIPPRAVTALPYTIQSGQSYVFGGHTPTDYYYAQTIDNSLPDDHTDVRGRQQYLEIQLGHRVAFVRATDVSLVSAGD